MDAQVLAAQAADLDNALAAAQRQFHHHNSKIHKHQHTTVGSAMQALAQPVLCVSKLMHRVRNAYLQLCGKP